MLSCLVCFVDVFGSVSNMVIFVSVSNMVIFGSFSNMVIFGSVSNMVKYFLVLTTFVETDFCV